MELRNGILSVGWAEGMSVSEADAVAFIEHAEAICRTTCPPMLVELNEMVTLSSRALNHFAKELNIGALALVGPSPVDKTIADHFTVVHNPPYPSRYFPHRNEALTWLTACSTPV
ncbi:DUF7793 family protein [Arthrobacter sp. MDT1-48-3]